MNTQAPVQAPTSVAVVGEIYAAFGRGDIGYILSCLADDVAWDVLPEPGGRAGMPWFEARRGPQEVAGFFEILAEQAEFHEFRVLSIIGDEREAAAEILLEGTNRTTGRRVRACDMHRWSFDADGKVARFDHYVDTHAHRAAAGTDEQGTHVVRDMLARWDAHDPAELEAIIEECLTPDALITLPLGVFGGAALLGMWSGFQGAMSDVHHVVTSCIEQGDRVIAEGRFVGTFDGPLPAPDGTMVPPNGNAVDLPFAAAYRIVDGRIAEGTVYFDNAAFMVQLGLA